MPKTIHNRVLVFDIDGVIKNPHSRVVNPRVIRAIADDLRAGIPVAINTGRAAEWIVDEIVPEIEQFVDKKELDHLLCVGEKGFSWARYVDGKPLHSHREDISLPAAFIADAKRILSDLKAATGKPIDTVAYANEGKHTMLSFAVRPDVAVEKFEAIHQELDAALHALLKKHHLSKDFRLTSDLIATDVEHVTSGKDKGSERILEWLESIGADAKEFYCFGDSLVDEAMAEHFASRGYDTTFIYVGRRELPKIQKAPHLRVVMNGAYDEDVVAYLESLAKTV